MNTATITQTRLERTRELMQEEGLDLLLVSPSSDLLYLIGTAGHASERPTLLAVGPAFPTLLVLPQLEAPNAETIEGVRIVPYADTENPYAALYDALGEPVVSRVAVSDEMRAAVLLNLQQTFPAASFLPASPFLRLLRMIKSPEEVDLLAQAGAMADAAFAQLVQRPFAGRTERDIAQELTNLLHAQGLTTATWGPSVASGPNGASPHHGAGSRVMQEGDAVVLDFGGSLHGYQADITRTVHIGEPAEEFRRVYQIVQQAQEAGVQAAQPGVEAQAVDAAARDVIHAAGYGDFFIHRTGHGLGLDTHEEPYIIAGNELRLEPGMVFSVEPGVYVPGQFGVRIEDIVVETENGPRRLNNAPRELIIVR